MKIIGSNKLERLSSVQRIACVYNQQSTLIAKAVITELLDKIFTF